MERSDISVKIGLNIKAERRRKKLSQEALALESNIHPSYFGCIERGEKCPTVETLYKISKALDVPLSKLIKVDENNSDENVISPEDRILEILKTLPADKKDKFADILEDISGLL